MPLGGKIFGVKRYPTHTKAWALKMRLWDIKMGTFSLENESFIQQNVVDLQKGIYYMKNILLSKTKRFLRVKSRLLVVQAKGYLRGNVPKTSKIISFYQRVSKYGKKVG